MKIKILLAVIFSLITFNLNAQDKVVFASKTAYYRYPGESNWEEIKMSPPTFIIVYDKYVEINTRSSMLVFEIVEVHDIHKRNKYGTYTEYNLGFKNMDNFKYAAGSFTKDNDNNFVFIYLDSDINIVYQMEVVK